MVYVSYTRGAAALVYATLGRMELQHIRRRSPNWRYTSIEIHKQSCFLEVLDLAPNRSTRSPSITEAPSEIGSPAHLSLHTVESGTRHVCNVKSYHPAGLILEEGPPSVVESER